MDAHSQQESTQQEFEHMSSEAEQQRQAFQTQLDEQAIALREAQVHLQESIDGCTTIRGELMATTRELCEAQDRYKISLEATADAKRQLEDVEEQLQQSSETWEQVRCDLKEQLEASRRQAKQLQEQISSDTLSSQAKQSALTDEIDRVQANYKEQTGQLVAANDHIGQLQGQLDETQRLNEQLKEWLASSKQKNAEAEAVMASELHELKLKYAESSTQLREESNALQQLQHDHNKLEQSYVKAQAETAALNARVEQLRGTLQEKEISNARFEVANQHLQQQIEKQEKHGVELEEQLHQTSTEARRRIQHLELDLTKAKQDVTAGSERSVLLSQELVALKEKFAEQQQQCQALLAQHSEDQTR